MHTIDRNDSFKALMIDKTNEELIDYLIDIRKHTADEVSAALEELQNRGKSYNETQLTYFRAVIKRKRLEESPDTPTYYSQQGITLFCILFSSLAGAILLSFNLKERREKWSVIGFGITYFVFLYILQDQTGLSFVVLTLNAFSAVLLKYIFWNPYIGNNIFYHKKSLLIPLLIALAIAIPYLISVYPELRQGFLEGWKGKI